MSRETLNRKWTSQEYELAHKIVYAVDSAMPTAAGGVVGSLQVCRLVGLPYGPKDRKRSMRRVQSVMPLAEMLTPVMVPGKALNVSRSHLYSITDDTVRVMRSNASRLKSIRTKTDRLVATMPVLAHSSDPTATAMLVAIGSLNNALAPDVWNAIIAETENAP